VLGQLKGFKEMDSGVVMHQCDVSPAQRALTKDSGYILLADDFGLNRRAFLNIHQ